MIKATIGATEYTKIKVLSFSPVVDVTSNESPVNTIVVEVQTDDEIENLASFVLEKDDTFVLRYFVTDVRSSSEGFKRIEAKSVLEYLDRDTMPAAMYNNEPFADIVDDIFANTEAKIGNFHATSSAITETITGYCPEQTARQRLQWICFVAGAFVKTEFSAVTQILPIDTSVELIPSAKTFWRPTVLYSDYITSIKIKYYSYTLGTPATTDKWVKAGNSYYIQTETEASAQNANAPQNARENSISFYGITLVNANNYLDILSRLEAFHFSRVDVTADILSLDEFKPSDRVQISNGEELFDGYIRSANYTFGNATKEKITLRQYTEIAFVQVVINFLFDIEYFVPSKSYRLPVGYNFVYDVDYYEVYDNNKRIVFLPNPVQVNITVPNKDTEIDVEVYDHALELENENLVVLSVSEVEENPYQQGVIMIG